MKLLAISDIHLGYEANRRAFGALSPRRDDWLILAGDVGESVDHLELALDIACARFAKVLWAPGNHELWADPPDASGLGGVAKYEELVRMCRNRGVATPEDPYLTWPGPGGPCVIAPIFTLYDYSFRPAHLSVREAVAWAAEGGCLSADEVRLDPAPFASREAWCRARCDATEARLAAIGPDRPTVLVGHFPLREDLVFIPRVPRFALWCGSTRTREWHQRFHARVVVSGHLHVRTTNWRGGVRFEEVSLGYPHQWRLEAGVDRYLREILPGTNAPPPGTPRYIP